MGRLAGKTVLITGAAQGIGAAAARLCVKEGARVVLVDVLEEPLAALTEELGEMARSAQADIADEQAVQNLVSTVVADQGGLDVAFLNAGISGRPHNLMDYPVELFDQVMGVNARGLFLCLKHVMRAMRGRGGSIVITSSVAGTRATPNMSAYIASKHASVGLMRSAAIDGAKHGIRVNSVNPATIDTPMVRAIGHGKPSHDAQAIEETRRFIPMGRQGQADEVANMMLFLASDESSFCTGGVYMVDGGVSAGRAF